MKKAILVLTVITSFVLTSCQKENVAPNTNPAVQHNVNVEYRVYCESANITLEMLAPKSGVNGLQSQTVTVNRNDYSFTFSTPNNTFLSLKAWNTNPSFKEITVEIYVNGTLYKSGTLDHSTSTASASGTFVE